MQHHNSLVFPTKALDFKQRFLQDGFKVIPAFMDLVEIGKLKEMIRSFSDLELGREDGLEGKVCDHHKDDLHIRFWKNLHYFDPRFESLLSDSRLQKLAKKLLGENVFGKEVQFLEMTSKSGRPFQPRQDGFQFMISPWEALTFTLVLEPMNTDNGCLHYVRGSHKLGMREHKFDQGNDICQGILDYGKEEDYWRDTDCFALPGDLIVHHALTIYGFQAGASGQSNLNCLRFTYFSENTRDLDQDALLTNLEVARLMPGSLV